MTKALGTTFALALMATACGGGQQQPAPVDAEKEARETIRRARTGEKVRATDSGLDPCKILGNGMVADLFGVDAAAITLSAGSSQHPLCRARWRKPNADEIEASSPQLMMDYMKRKMEAQQKGLPFDEKMPVPRAESEVNLTLVKDSFANAAAAVANLEQTVARLTEGVTVEVQGKKHTTQVAYDDWMPGVGDKAAWAPKLSQLSVAAKGVVYHVGVEVSSDAAENRARAIELARKVAEAL